MTVAICDCFRRRPELVLGAADAVAVTVASTPCAAS
jgi:hypothetical protein